jgi:hypothetical protein
MSTLSSEGPDSRSRASSTADRAGDAAYIEECEADIAEAFAKFVEAETSLWRFVLAHPVRTIRTIRTIRELPALDAVLPDTAEAEHVRDQLLENAVSRRAMLGVSAVLETPTVAGTYTDGHSRATVRRKIRAAEKHGVTVRPVPPEERPALLALADLHERHNAREQYRNTCPANDDLLSYDLWFAAYDAHDQPIMLSVTPTAGEWGVLRYFRTLVSSQASSDARYLMARELAEALAARGVRRLVDSARPHWLPNGLRHFQRMIGFRMIRIPSVTIAKD